MKLETIYICSECGTNVGIRKVRFNNGQHDRLCEDCIRNHKIKEAAEIASQERRVDFDLLKKC